MTRSVVMFSGGRGRPSYSCESSSMCARASGPVVVPTTRPRTSAKR
ncbi:hypothetical protein ACI8AB_08350 [Geodermatophilus sp. SYSU D00698]